MTRSGDLQVIKECSAFTGGTGRFTGFGARADVWDDAE